MARARETVALADERRRLENERMTRIRADAMPGSHHTMWPDAGERSRAAGLFTLLGELFT